MAKNKQSINTVSENIRILDGRADMTQKQRNICTEQLCRLIMDEGDGIYSVWEDFCRLSGEGDVVSRTTLCRHICESPR